MHTMAQVRTARWPTTTRTSPAVGRSARSRSSRRRSAGGHTPTRPPAGGPLRRPTRRPCTWWRPRGPGTFRPGPGTGAGGGRARRRTRVSCSSSADPAPSRPGRARAAAARWCAADPRCATGWRRGPPGCPGRGCTRPQALRRVVAAEGLEGVVRYGPAVSPRGARPAGTAPPTSSPSSHNESFGLVAVEALARGPRRRRRVGVCRWPWRGRGAGRRADPRRWADADPQPRKLADPHEREVWGAGRRHDEQVLLGADGRPVVEVTPARSPRAGRRRAAQTCRPLRPSPRGRAHDGGRRALARQLVALPARRGRRARREQVVTARGGAQVRTVVSLVVGERAVELRARGGNPDENHEAFTVTSARQLRLPRLLRRRRVGDGYVKGRATTAGLDDEAVDELWGRCCACDEPLDQLLRWASGLHPPGVDVAQRAASPPQPRGVPAEGGARRRRGPGGPHGEGRTPYPASGYGWRHTDAATP